MKKVKIVCPECNHEFSPDLKHQLEHILKREHAGLIDSFSEKEKAILKEEIEHNKKSTAKIRHIIEKLWLH
jgi:hypothetical protein